MKREAKIGAGKMIIAVREEKLRSLKLQNCSKLSARHRKLR
jgi:hypothetical protein